jgi:hypothetical protein
MANITDATTGNETIDALTKALNDAAEAKQKLVARLDVIRKEKKDTMARLTAEAKSIRALVGRSKVTKPKATTPRAPRVKKAAEVKS